MGTFIPPVRSALMRGLTAIAFLVWAGVASAAQGVAVAPPRFELVVAPGESATEEVAVFAQGVGPQTVMPAVVSWTLSPDYRVVVFDNDSQTPAYSAAPWISIGYDPLRLEPDKPVTVRFGVQVPADPAMSGSYRAALAFTTQPQPGVHDGVSALINVRVLSVVYVTIKGTEQPAAELQGVTVATDEDSGKRYLVADVANTGNVYLRLNGELRFVNTAGEVAQRVELPERVLLREGLVRYRLALPEDLPDDVILAQIEIQPQGPAGGYGGPPLYGEVPVD